jgi:hypothetical protein
MTSLRETVLFLGVEVLTRLMQEGRQDAGCKQDAPGKQRKRRWLLIM